MINCTHRQVLLLAVLCGIMFTISAKAQTYVRYVNPQDINSEVLYSDSVLTSITLPHGVAKLDSYPEFDRAIQELKSVMADPTKEILKVRICASASPDGLWQDNQMLAQARLNSAVSYLKSNVNISDFYLQKENLEEDWDRLYEILQTSDIPYKAEVLDIIKTKSWGSRKLALQKLDGGRVWRLLEKEYFPALRCVRFAIFCKWDPSKPYLTAQVAQPAYTPYSSPVAHPTPMVQPSPVVKEIYREIIREIVRDTVYIRDTVHVKEIIHKRDTIYILREQIANAESLFAAPAPTSAAPAQTSYVPQKAKSQPYLHDTPWMMGIKTNLLTDAMAIPMAGLEFQIARSVSLDLSGWCTTTNIFNKQDENTNFYGFSPELRWWIGNNTMRKGSFVGLTSTIAWYTLQWKDGLLYQNGPENVWQDNTHDPGNSTPAWSAGMVYGYSLGLGRKAHWGLEFYVGIGYAKYRQNTAAYNGNIWEYIEHQNKNHFGLTKAGINLAYRFSTRKVKPEYYE